MTYSEGAGLPRTTLVGRVAVVKGGGRGIADADRDAYAGELRARARHIAKQEAALPAWIRDREMLATALTQLRARRETVEAMATALSAGAAERSAGPWVTAQRWARVGSPAPGSGGICLVGGGLP